MDQVVVDICLRRVSEDRFDLGFVLYSPFLTAAFQLLPQVERLSAYASLNLSTIQWSRSICS